jgi:hypothetical protein
VVRDLILYAQMQGRSNVASCWCMWCKMSAKQWKMNKAEVLQAHREQWTIKQLKQTKLHMNEGLLMDPSPMHGVVMGFFDVYPVLHGEIGLVDENIEKLSEEEKTARNVLIMVDIG